MAAETGVPRSPRAEWQPVRRVAPRVHSGEVMSASCALLLAPIMFVLEWFGVVGMPEVRRSGINGAENAWHALTLLRWLMLLTILVALGAVILHASQRGHGARTDTGIPVAALGTLTAVLVGYRVLIDPPNPAAVVDIKLGAMLGLLAALGIALGGWGSVREERARRDSVLHRVRNPPVPG
jgi:hypothetical protein